MKSPNFGRPQAGEGSSFLPEAIILLLAALVGATITVIGGFFVWAWKGAQKVSTPFLPTRTGLERALNRCNGNSFKAITLSVLEQAMGHELEKVAIEKVSEIPPMTESEARTQLEELGFSPDSGFKARWDRLSAEGKVAREEAAKPSAAPAPAHRGPSINEIFGIAKMAMAELKGLIPVPAPSAADQARLIEAGKSVV